MMQTRPEQQPTGKDEAPSSTFGVSAPSINLPKGGGAFRGMGEKFSANPVTGAGSMSVPCLSISTRDICGGARKVSGGHRSFLLSEAIGRGNNDGGFVHHYSQE